MTQKTYRTAQGKIVDLGALQLQNENVRAVGNMGVNARGDVIDGHNRPIDPKTQQVKRQYNKQTTNVQDVPLAHVATKPVADNVEIPAALEDFDDNFVKPAEKKVSEKTSAPVTPEETKQANTGLAAAIAKARTIKKQDPAETKAPIRKI